MVVEESLARGYLEGKYGIGKEYSQIVDIARKFNAKIVDWEVPVTGSHDDKSDLHNAFLDLKDALRALDKIVERGV